jgi:hypothetical protein
MGRSWFTWFTEQPDGSAPRFDDNFLSNYNCQRYLVAKVYHNEYNWVVDQRMYGPVTISDDLLYSGGILMAPVEPGTPWVPAYGDKQADWDGSWDGYTKDGNPDNCTIQVRPYP